MAQGVKMACGGCGRSITAWDDGNPYYLDEHGAKQYAYHPDHDRLALCIGNDTPHLCLACGLEFKDDSRSPLAACPGCGSPDHVATFDLEGRRCPDCKAGEFAIDPDFFLIS